MRRKAVIAALLLAIGSGFLLVAGVAAHSRPIRFQPAPGAVLDAAPAKVEGWFTAELRRDSNWTFLQVTDAQGGRVDAGEITLSADRRQMSVDLRPNLPPGRYVVTWRGFDDGDGAIFGDCYAFYVGQAAADAAVAGKLRLDGGGNNVCARIDVSARDGTPVPGQTPAAAATPAPEGHTDEGAAGEDDGEDGGIPVWGLVVGVVAGVVAGGIGGRYLGGRS